MYLRLIDKWLYIIRVLHQTTTLDLVLFGERVLYIIRVLHQTTTVFGVECKNSSCILLEFYIKPQLGKSHDVLVGGCILLEFYIKPQPRDIGNTIVESCILLEFYIKPQLLPTFQ